MTDKELDSFANSLSKPYMEKKGNIWMSYEDWIQEKYWLKLVEAEIIRQYLEDDPTSSFRGILQMRLRQIKDGEKDSTS